jgi:hypothetical protein
VARKSESGVSVDNVEDLIDLMGSQVAVADAYGVSRAHVCQSLRRARARRWRQEKVNDGDKELSLEDIL